MDRKEGKVNTTEAASELSARLGADDELIFLRKLRVTHEQQIKIQQNSIDNLSELVESLRDGIVKEVESEEKRLNAREIELVKRGRALNLREAKTHKALRQVLEWLKTLPNNGHSWLREMVEDALDVSA